MKKILISLVLLLSLLPVSAQFDSCLPGICGGANSADPSWASVVLLMPFEGSNGATGAPGMTDVSSAAHGDATVGGAAQISTTHAQFGASSLKVAPTDDGIFYPSHVDWNLSTANSSQLTIEFWFYPTTLTINKALLGRRGVLDGTYDYNIQIDGATSSELDLCWSPTGFFAAIVCIGTSGAGIVTGQFFAIAVTKDSGGTIRIFVNGVVKATSTPANSIFFNSGQVLTIGGNTAASNAADGWLDEVRITKGVARYTAGYTPATSAFPTH